MSTDYGFRCKQCGDSVVFDNLRFYGVSHAAKNTHALAELYASYCALAESAQALELDIEISAYWAGGGVKSLLEWLQKHDGHSLVLLDEYGREHAIEEQKQ